MDDVRESSVSVNLLQLFDSLSQAEQATALETIQANQQSAQDTGELANIHSCALCRSFGLSWDSPERDEALASIREQLPDFENSGAGEYFEYPYLSRPCSLTKEAVLRGLSRKCLLFQWVSALLSRTLAPFKTELRQRGISTRFDTRSNLRAFQDEDLDDPQYDLDFIDPARGLGVRLEVDQSAQAKRRFRLPQNPKSILAYMPGDQAEGALSITYEPDPILLDRAWSSNSPLVKKAGYAAFEQTYHGICETSLTFYTTSGLISAGQSMATIEIEDSFSCSRDWLRTCNDEHPHCARKTGILPTRVIDVGRRDPVRTVNLYWPEENETGQYVALSYCWGGKQELVTTTATAQQNTDGIPVSKIPKTILDAIILTQKLGLRFLWVDALCIIQDDPEDVAREVSQMAQIYQEAHLTVSAACSNSVTDGFLFQRSRPAIPTLKLPFTFQDNTQGFIYMQQPQRYSAVEDPIHLRAWTLQEHILPHRMLLFGARGLRWTCPSKGYPHAPNTFGDTEWNPALIGAMPPTLASWRSILSDYTRRFLTLSTDKLPAIAGIAAHYSKALGSAYRAGLWEVDLVSELMWCSVRADITRPVVQRGPSWSWVSVDGEIHHDWCPSTLGSREPRVLQCTAAPASKASPFGSVDPQRCVLILEADMARVHWHADRKRLYSWLPGVSVDDATSHLEIGRSQADALEIDMQGVAMDVWALLIEDDPCRGLLLVEADLGSFRRVGVFYRIWEMDACRFARRVVTIV